MTELHKHHPESPNGQDDAERNASGNAAFAEILRVSRRHLLKGCLGLAATGLGQAAFGKATTNASAFRLGFSPVAKSIADMLSIPAGYSAQALYKLGDPIDTATPAYANDGSDSADSFRQRAGDHHDGMAYFGLDATGKKKDPANSRRGLLCVNHENINQQFLHSDAELRAGLGTASRLPAQIDKEVNAHGVSVIEIGRDGRQFSVNRRSAYNRRYTAASPMALHGPARGNALLKTAYSSDGTATRGTLNNCAMGQTPWGTYLTCEENWAGYFKRPAHATLAAGPATAQARYIGTAAGNGAYGWANPADGDHSGDGLYKRWDLTPHAAEATHDYRNAANTFGWVVEIDPYTPQATPRKRTALGRFGHEGAMPAKAVAGKPVVIYMGDDAKGEYIYKYVSRRPWHAADANGGLVAGDKYLDEGKLYVATFATDGSGTWQELDIGNDAVARHPAYAFADQGDVLINARLAADAVGATPMDRPEWAGIHPLTGDVYVTLTYNIDRGLAGTTTGGQPRGPDAANPRAYNDGHGHSGNVNGHIVRLRENGGDHAATSFRWDIYLFGSRRELDGADINLSGLSDGNDFSAPDGLWFSQANPGLLWLETDDPHYLDASNCMLLAAVPGSCGDGGPVAVHNRAVPSNGGRDQTVTTYAGQAATPDTLRRFLVGPKGCEITGVAETPDGRALFVNIQHPGENTTVANVIAHAYESHWPEGGGARPRSTTVVITKDDGGLIGA